MDLLGSVPCGIGWRYLHWWRRQVQQCHPQNGLGNADVWELPIWRSGISDGPCSLSERESTQKIICGAFVLQHVDSDCIVCVNLPRHTNHKLEEKPGLLQCCFPHCARADHPLQCQLLVEQLDMNQQIPSLVHMHNQYQKLYEKLLRFKLCMTNVSNCSQQNVVVFKDISVIVPW